MSKQITFPLIIDKDRDMVLNFMCQYANSNPMFIHDMTALKLEDAVLSFCDDMKKGSMVVAWCNAPECEGKAMGECPHKKKQQ